MRIRCVTINLKGVESSWFREREKAIKNGLTELAPDILFFQEATICQTMPLYNQAMAIGKELALSYSVFLTYGNPVETTSLEQGGVAVVSRWPFGEIRNRKLPSGHSFDRDSRVALFASVETPFGNIMTVNTHLSWKHAEADARAWQMDSILDELKKSSLIGPIYPTILAGDLNACPEERSIAMAAHLLQDTYSSLHPTSPGHTWTRTNPWALAGDYQDRRIDYIFCDRGAIVKDCRVVLNRANPVYPSDHFGVFAEIEWIL